MNQSQPTAGTDLPPVRIIGDPVLRKKAKAVAAIDATVRREAEMLTAAMLAFDGLGMAAPQIGLSRRLVALFVPRPKEVLTDNLSPGEAFLLPRMPVALVNPRLLDRSDEMATRDEGCLSVPEIFAPVTRPVRVTVRALLLDGTEFELPCAGLLGRALQHEIDHLDGVLFVDRLTAAELGRIKSRLNRLKKTAGKVGFKRVAKVKG